MALSCWPLVYMAALGGIALPWWSTVQSSGVGVRQVVAVFWTFVAIHILTMIVALALWIYALVRLQRPDFQDPRRPLWLVALLFAAPVALPFFFWRHGPRD